MDNKISRFKFFILIILLATHLTGCKSGIEGTYISYVTIFGQSNKTIYEFNSNNKVYVKSPLDGEKELNYKVDGKRVIIGNDKDNIVLNLSGDGQMTGRAGIFDVKLLKIKKFTEEELEKMLTNYYISKSNINKIMWTKIVQVGKLKKLSEDINESNEHVVDINFDVIRRIDLQNIESFLSKDEFKLASGDNDDSTYDTFIKNIKKSKIDSSGKIDETKRIKICLQDNNSEWKITKITQ